MTNATGGGHYRPNSTFEVWRVEPREFVVRAASYFGALAALGGGAVAIGGVGSGFCSLAIGLVLAHGTELSHQALHRLGTGHPLTDDALGMAMCWPTGISFRLYQSLHLHHHRTNGAEAERESFAYDAYSNMQSPRRSLRLFGLFRHLSMADHFAATAQRLGLALFGRLKPALQAQWPHMTGEVAGAIQNECRAMAAAYAAVVLLTGFGVIPAHIVVALWLIPLVAWAPAHALIELPEHWATASRPNQNAFENTRTILCSKFASYYTNGNNWHVEHHSNMRIPMNKLGIFHAALKENGNAHRYIERGYPRFYLNYLKALWGQIPH